MRAASGTRWYRLLLHLYPASFRAEYGDELTAAFAANRAGSSAAGAAIDAMVDVVPNALAAHWDILRADLRQAARAFQRSPGFAMTAILVIALGVGANAAAFSVADFVLLRPLPFPHPDRLVDLWETTPGYGHMELSPGNYKDWKAQAKSFSAVALYVNVAMNLSGQGEPQRIEVAGVSSDLFPLLGAHAYLGRTFTAADTLAGTAIVLSYDLWQSEFGGDDAMVGRAVELDGARHDVIGVMPPDFHYPSRDVKLWTATSFAAADFADRTNNWVYGIARLAPHVTVAQANAEAALIAGRLERAFPKDNKNTGELVVPLRDELSTRSRLLLVALCGAALCILLLACANLGNLLLARTVARGRELAVRAALGAGRERLIRQIVTESALLSLAGGVVGVAAALAGVPALARLVPSTLPIAQQPSIDLRVLAFAAVLILVTGVGFSLIPALRAANAGTFAALRDDARSGGGAKQRVRSVLVAVEVMASVVLLISSGLLVRAMWRIQSIDPGFRPDGVLTVRTALPWPKYEGPGARQRFYSSVLSHVRALPGVASAGYVSGLPMVMGGGLWPVSTRGDASVRSAANSAGLRYATPGYFAALQIPVEQGRDVQDTDTPDRPYVAVVSESFAKKYWPREPALGKEFTVAFHPRIVVGVVGDVHVRGLEGSSEPQMYLPYRQQDSASLIFYTPKDLVIRSTTPKAALAPEIRRVVHDADPLQPVSDVQMMADVVANDTAPRAVQLRVLGMLAAIALLLSAVGIHGVLSFTVSQRAREIGVRMALGAESGQVRRMILREGLAVAVAGLVPGAAIAYLAGRGMQAALFGVSPGDGATFAAAIAVCAATTLLGALRPAMRASRVDPVTAMRAE